MKRIGAVLWVTLTAGACVGPEPASDGRIPLAILGDSDSESYAALDFQYRGGEEYRPYTLQWTEVLSRLRGDRLGFGEWGTWGFRYRYTVVLRFLGIASPWPPKTDFRYNLALSGAPCSQLREGRARQVPSLLRILSTDPERWSRGVIVIRIGINSVGGRDQLDAYAREGLDQTARNVVASCIGHIRRAVEDIRSVHADVRLALVGIAEDTNTELHAGRWTTPDGVRRIREVLDHFDRELMALADEDSGAVFVDDRDWFVRWWGGRDESGVLRTKSVALGGPVGITNSIGDHPSNAVIEDGHAGTVLNALWANELVSTLNRSFALGVNPLHPGEIADLVDPTGRFGISPGRIIGSLSRTEIPSLIEVEAGELPATIGVALLDGWAPADLVSTAVAWVQHPDGSRTWLYGDGLKIELREGQLGNGRYDLRVLMRDRDGKRILESTELVLASTIGGY